MNIKTKEFEMTKWEYYKVLMIETLKRIWWLIVFIAIMTILNRDSFAIVFTFVFVVFLMLYNYYFVNSRANKSFFSKRYFEVNDEFLSGYVKDGSEGKINLNNVVKVVKNKSYFLIYISKVTFYYIPLNAFYSSEDIDSLYALLRTKTKK